MKSRMIAYLSQPRKDSEETEEIAAQAFALEALTKQLYSWRHKDYCLNGKECVSAKECPCPMNVEKSKITTLHPWRDVQRRK